MRVTEFNVGQWCLSEDDCIAQGINFAAYERGVSDAARAFAKNPSPSQPLLTDEDWQAIADKTERIIPGRVIAAINEHIAAKLADGVRAAPAPNPCKLTECKGKPRCEKCVKCGLNDPAGVTEARTDHIRAVPGGAAFLRVAGATGVTAAHAPTPPDDKITIRYERAGRCFWHIGCTAQRHAPPMAIGEDDSAKRHTVVSCTACGEAGYYPFGSVGDVHCERAPKDGVRGAEKTSGGDVTDAG